MDTIDGVGLSPSFVLGLIMRLPDTSFTAALMSGGREYFGWGMDRHMQADIYDAQNLTTRAAGNWRDKPPEIPAWPRPGVSQERPSDEPVSVRDLYKKFQGR